MSSSIERIGTFLHRRKISALFRLTKQDCSISVADEQNRQRVFAAILASFVRARYCENPSSVSRDHGRVTRVIHAGVPRIIVAVDLCVVSALA